MWVTDNKASKGIEAGYLWQPAHIITNIGSQIARGCNAGTFLLSMMCVAPIRLVLGCNIWGWKHDLQLFFCIFRILLSNSVLPLPTPSTLAFYSWGPGFKTLLQRSTILIKDCGFPQSLQENAWIIPFRFFKHPIIQCYTAWVDTIVA